MSGGKRQNSFWRARKRGGLKQKQIASLLGYKTVDQVSRYENGTQLPTLRTVLKLEIILGAPAKVLFSDLYEDVVEEINSRLTANVALRSYLPQFRDTDFCSFAELLRSPNLSEQKIDKIRAHAIYMTKALGDQLQKTRKLTNEQDAHG